MTAERPVEITVDGLRLEGRLDAPAAAVRGAVVCHPHPQYGGNMESNVVVAVARALRAAGVATLRFNFRGVGASEGTYGGGGDEVADARGAVACLRDSVGSTDVTLVGYSFGAAVAARAAADDPGAIARLVLIAPPLAFAPLDFLAECTTPTLLVAGSRDDYRPRVAIDRLATTLHDTPPAVVIDGADHFFFGAETELARVVTRFTLGELA